MFISMGKHRDSTTSNYEFRNQVKKPRVYQECKFSHSHFHTFIHRFRIYSLHIASVRPISVLLLGDHDCA